MSKLSGVLAVMSALLCGGGPAGAATYFVAPSGSDAAAGTNWVTAKQTIQAAVTAAAASDTVLVSNGVYQTGGVALGGLGLVLTNRVAINKAITVQSVNGPAVTIIRGAKDPVSTNNGPAAVRCVWLASNATLSGFTLTNGATRASSVSGTDDTGGGVWSQVGGTISNCIVTGNSASYRSGGVYQGVLNNCTLIGNSAGAGGGAMLSTLNNCTLTGNSALQEGGGANQSTLNNCRLNGNSANNGAGAYQGTLNNCTVTGNSAVFDGSGTYLSTLNNSIVYFNSPGSNVTGGTINYTCTTPLPTNGTGNITNNPLFVSLATTNLALAAGSPCINRGNNASAPPDADFAGNPRIVFGVVDMGAFEYQTPPASGAVHYVARGNPNAGFPYTNWTTAAATIQVAIDAAVPGNTVLVSNGVYETGGRVAANILLLLTNRVIIDKPITVRSVNGPAVTIIKGAKDPVTFSNGNAAVRCVWVASNATLSGFTLTNGATRIYDLGIGDEMGGGAWCAPGGMLSNCVLSGNSAAFGGGARQGQLVNCTLTGNSADTGGGVYESTLNNCTLTGNSAVNGGGAAIGTLSNCTLAGNSAVYGGGAINSTLNNCTISGNSADTGGGVNDGTLNNCALTGNSANYGGGAAGGTLNNCTLTGNSASGFGGGGARDCTLNNCIVYFNAAPTDSNYYNSTISYTCTTPLPAGTGNITNVPLFVSLATTNLALAANSPCRDIGNNAFAPGTKDLASNPRIVNGSADMGAYEIQTLPAPGSAIHYVRLGSSNPQSPFASWATAATNIQPAIDAAAPGDMVLVSNGVYQTGGRVAPGSLLTNRVVIDKPITIQSVNGPANTIIKGAGPLGNTAVRCAWMTNGATLVGFTLTNGATRTSLTDLDGGGLWAQSSAAVVSNCIFTGNFASFYGGGAYGGTLNNCTLTGNQAFDTGGGVFDGTLNNCIVTNNSAPSGGGSYGGTLSRCTLTGNAALTGAGAYGGTLNNCTLTGNVSTDNGGGAFNAVLNACTLTGNSAVYGGGAAFGTLNNCLLTGNSAVDSGGGAFVATLKNSTVVGNSASTNGGGVYLGTLANCIVYLNTAPTSNNYYNTTISHTCTTPLPAGTGNITNDPMFISSTFKNYRLRTGSPCRDAGNNANAPGSSDLDGNTRIENATVDMGAYEFQLSATGTTHYVDLNNPTPLWPHATWATAATNIQDAIDAADASDTVLVSNGVYQTGGRLVSGSFLMNRVLIDKAITVSSVNGPAVTTIKGAWHPGTTNGSAAVRCVRMNNGARLVGFTLTNGATRTSSPTAADLDGGGLYAQSPLSLVSNCVLSGNAAHDAGGSAFNGSLNNCALTGNSAYEGGGAYSSTLNNCTLAGNSAYEGAGAYGSALSNCTLSGNSAVLSGGTSYSTLNNSTLTGNSAEYHGGAYDSILNNCTLAGNSASIYGGGAYYSTLNNCIVYFNTAPVDPNHFESTINFTCTTPLPTNGTGNITNDPKFVSLATTNLQLAANSPCINTGNNANAPGATDLIYNPRIVGGTVDMGAYEYNQLTANYDSDTDGFTDAEEYIANTQATNAASFFQLALVTNAPAGQMSLVIIPTSTGRVYGVFANTNLLQTPQLWTLVPPEQTGTASALTLTVTNTLPGANFRTGVRLP